MAKVRREIASWIACALVILVSSFAPAQSRVWSPDSASLARDYLIINDNRGHGDIVFMLWMAAPMIPDTPATQAARVLLDKYVVIGVVHAHVSSDAAMTFDKTEALTVNDGSGQPLNSLSPNTMPPAVVGTLATLQSAFARSFGAFGTGVQWFAFDSGTTRACTKGELSVPFADTNYTFVTPIPGCP